MTASSVPLRVAVATHATRDLIGSPPHGSFEHWSGLDAFIQFALGAGFDGVDLSTSVFDVRRDDAWWDAFGGHVTGSGLALASLNCLRSSLADQSFWQLGFYRIRRAIEIASLLRIPTVNISLAVPPERLDANAHRVMAAPPGSSVVATTDDVDRTIRHLDKLADIAEGTGVALVLELHHCSIVDTGEAMARLVSRLGGRFTANPDLVNELWAFETVKTNWRDTLVALAPLTGEIWHIKNCRRLVDAGRTEFVDAPLDEGDIDYTEAVAIMRTAGFQGWVSIERSGEGDFLTTATRGRQFLHSLKSAKQRSTT